MPDPRTSTSERSNALFEQLRRTGDPAVRQELVCLHLPLARHFAVRFSGRGEPLDDLVQVASLALVKAVDRFDPERDVQFASFAAPTILGELKRYFRDSCWTVRVGRRLQENHLKLRNAAAELSQELQRSPTVAELAAHVGMTVEDATQALEAADVYAVESIDAPAAGGESTRAELLGAEDERVALFEELDALSSGLQQLDDRERRIVQLRFFDGCTQQEIAQDLGISQMHVSRLLGRILGVLRARAETEQRVTV